MKLSYFLLLITASIFLACGGSGESSPEANTETQDDYPTDTQTYTASSSEFILTSPANGAVVLKDHKLVVKIGNELDMNVSRVEYWADNDSLLLADTQDKPFSVTIDTALLSNGEHSIRAYAYNEEGEKIHSQVVQVNSYSQSFKEAKEYHVSTTGSPNGDGSIENPWDVTTAFGNYIAGVIYPSPVKPGDIIWMHGGNYDTPAETSGYKTFLVGTKEKPIIVRAYGDGPVDIKIGTSSTWPTISSAYNWFWGFDMNTQNTNRLNKHGSYERIGGFSLDMPGHNVINCVLSDMGHPAIGAWSHMADGEIYGTIIWGTGHYEEGTGLPTRGSAIYTQNVGDYVRSIRDVISFRNFTNGVKPYTEQGNVDNYHIEGTVGFKNGGADIIVVASNNAIQNLKVINNYNFQEENVGGTSVSLGHGYDLLNNNGLELKGNYFVGGSNAGGALITSQWNNMDVQNNTLITKYNEDDIRVTPRLFTYVPSASESNNIWNNNSYFGGRDSSLGDDNFINYYTSFINPNDRQANYSPKYNLEHWQRDMSPYDKGSTWTRNRPQENAIFVRPNLYERGRGHIIIYNWEDKDKVMVDISTLGLDEGEAFEVRDVQNYYGPVIISAIYSHDKSNIELPMTLTAVAQVVGEITHMDESLTHTSSKFASFVVLKK